MKPLTITTFLLSIILGMSMAQATPFGKLSLEDKIRVRTNEMAVVMGLNDIQKQELMLLNRTKFEKFKEIGKSKAPSTEKKKQAKKINMDYMNKVKTAFTSKKLATWVTHVREQSKK